MLREIDGRADVRERLSCVEGFESDSGCFGWCFQHFTDVAMRSQIAKQFAEGFELVQLGKIGDAIVRVTKCIVFRHDEANVYETIFPQGINSVSKS
ncbi:hypothetical protein HZH66_000871 [Vespula vulgaris]|uniref:Uncharacterized protein n=1 Tax=Vespula vulgaris TaxID=7454 RepID=A0A834NJ20_VESVU|nr:hypothetical protein HZH66_000871 [Vespula vulgaris]